MFGSSLYFIARKTKKDINIEINKMIRDKQHEDAKNNKITLNI